MPYLKLKLIIDALLTKIVYSREDQAATTLLGNTAMQHSPGKRRVEAGAAINWETSRQVLEVKFNSLHYLVKDKTKMCSVICHISASVTFHVL